MTIRRENPVGSNALVVSLFVLGAAAAARLECANGRFVLTSLRAMPGLE